MELQNQIEQWIHSANNCRQMLYAMDKQMARAIDCLESDPEKARLIIGTLRDALPRAIDALDPKNNQGD